MREVVIVAAVRTAIGSLGGTLKEVPVAQLASSVITAGFDRLGLEPQQIDQVIMGNAKQSSDAPNLARVASLYAGLPVTTPGYTVHRQCGSGLQAIIAAVQEIMLGDSEAVIAGGAESMSTAPYYIRKARFGFGSGNGELLDPNTESQPMSQPVEQYGRLTMGMTAENLAERYNISRSEQDEFALESQRKAIDAVTQGRFCDEIIPMDIKVGKTVTPFSVDEYPRKTNLQAMELLKPIFKQGGTVTAGNSSGRNDGAAAVVVMERTKADEWGIKPLARIVAYAHSGVSPDIMGIGPVSAVQKALVKAGLSLRDIGLIELNEAFAAQALACIKELGLKRDKVNVNGGAIALGHPIGASGARIAVTLLNEIQKREVRYGLCTLCIAGGQGSAMIVEKV